MKEIPKIGTHTLANEGIKPNLPYHVRRKLVQKRLSFLVGPVLTLMCDTCGVTWRPETKGRQRFSKGYWRYPNHIPLVNVGEKYRHKDHL